MCPVVAVVDGGREVGIEAGQGHVTSTLSAIARPLRFSYAKKQSFTTPPSYNEISTH